MEGVKVRTVALRMSKTVDVGVNIEVKAAASESDEEVMEEMRLRFEDNAEAHGWWSGADVVEHVNVDPYVGPRHGQRFRTDSYWTVRMSKLVQNDGGIQKAIKLMLDALAAGAPIESITQAMEDEADAAYEQVSVEDAIETSEAEENAPMIALMWKAINAGVPGDEIWSWLEQRIAQKEGEV